MTGYRNHSTSPEPVAVHGDLPICSNRHDSRL